MNMSVSVFVRATASFACLPLHMCAACDGYGSAVGLPALFRDAAAVDPFKAAWISNGL